MGDTHVSKLAGENAPLAMNAKPPWWLTLCAKLILARVPASYHLWRRIGLFRHGEMNIPQKAIDTFRSYFQCANKYASLRPGFHSLELGPGDSILSGIAARAHGADRVWLIDVGAFASTDVIACQRTVELLATEGKPMPSISGAKELSDVLSRTGISYLTNGTVSLREIPDASVDLFWSQVVFEHVYRDEIPVVLAELRRIVKPNAVGVHGIDFRDHLGGGLNNLRFSRRIWESWIFRNSGFYTNRIQPSEMVDFFKKAGFHVRVVREMRWPSMPIDRRKLDSAFSTLSDSDLLTAEMEIIVRPI